MVKEKGPKPYSTVLGVSLVDVEIDPNDPVWKKRAKEITSQMDAMKFERLVKEIYVKFCKDSRPNQPKGEIYFVSEQSYTTANFDTGFIIKAKDLPKEQNELDKIIDDIINAPTDIGIIALDQESEKRFLNKGCYSYHRYDFKTKTGAWAVYSLKK